MAKSAPSNVQPGHVHMPTPGSMAFPRGVPAGQTAHQDMSTPTAGHVRAVPEVVQDIMESVQWGLLPMAAYFVLSNVLSSGQVASRDIGVAMGLFVLFGVLAFVMSRRAGR
jgi:hypothetical protein